MFAFTWVKLPQVGSTSLALHTFFLVWFFPEKDR